GGDDRPPREEPGDDDRPRPVDPPVDEPVLLASVEDSVAAGVMTLESFGTSGTAVMSFQAVAPEDPGTCAVRGRDPVVIPVASSDESVAVVTPGAVSYDACSGIDSIVVHPVSEGVATVKLATPTEAPEEARFDLADSTFEVRVVEELPRNVEPTIEVPPGIRIETDDPAGAEVSWEIVASDREDGVLTPSCTPRSGSLLPLGDTEVICSATDSGGLSDTGRFVVTVVPFRGPGEGPEEPPPPEPGAPDAAKPFAPSLVVPAPDFQGPTGAWHRDAVTVGVRHNGDRVPQDGSRVSGVDPTSFERQITVSGSGVHTIAGVTVTDRAGNESNPAPEVAVRVDATAPSTALTCPAVASEGGAAFATWTAIDHESGLSGAEKGSLALDTSTPGRRAARLAGGAAADNVGHASAPATCTYIVAPAPVETPAEDIPAEDAEPQKAWSAPAVRDEVTDVEDPDAEDPDAGDARDADEPGDGGDAAQAGEPQAAKDPGGGEGD
ncbi:MAG: hypothetical protein ACRDJ5_07490, partial [Actinomycetota bacterium]